MTMDYKVPPTSAFIDNLQSRFKLKAIFAQVGIATTLSLSNTSPMYIYSVHLTTIMDLREIAKIKFVHHAFQFHRGGLEIKKILFSIGWWNFS